MQVPRNNLDEVIRRQKQPQTPTPVVREQALAPPRGPRFKPASSMVTPIAGKSTPSLKPRASLSSFSTPGFGKKKPPVPRANGAETQTNYVTISSTETTPIRDPSPSVPVKRTSSDSIIEVEPAQNVKRIRVDPNSSGKENVFRVDAKGKGREYPSLHHSPSQLKSSSALPQVDEDCGQSSSSLPFNEPSSSGSDSFRRLYPPLDYSDMLTMSEVELQNDQEALLNLRTELMDRRETASGGLLTVLKIFNELLRDRMDCTKSILTAKKKAEMPILPPTPWKYQERSYSAAQSVPPTSQRELSVPNTGKILDNDLDVVSAPRPVTAARSRNVDYDSDDQLWDAIGGIDDGFQEVHQSLAESRNDNATKTPFYSEVMKTLRNIFGLQQFRPFQLEAINAALSGKDAFILFPTGGGKSLCFQLPAVCKWGTKGLTVVVSPLLSLIQNQTSLLREKGIDVVTLGSSGENGLAQVKEIGQRLRPGNTLPNLLYCTPEKLEHSSMLQDILSKLNDAGQLSRFVIDEAHCISLWGMDFRIAYKNLVQLRVRYPKVPIMALTATANPQTQDDVIETLKISGCVRLTQPFNRPNLWYEVRKKNKNTLDQIVTFIRSKHLNHTGVIYCSSRDKCEILAQQLRDQGLSAQHYHAAVEEQEKKRIQSEWQSDKCKIIVATIAFGMGIDKPDVRFVIHHAIPTSLDGYYQESGRAGRDGKPADCILFYAYSETTFMFKRIRDNTSATQEVKDHQRDGLQHMIAYCDNDVDCRRVQVLSYFGQPITPEECAMHCDNCADGVETHEQDVSEPARSALKLATSLTSGGVPVTRAQLVTKIYSQVKDARVGGKSTPKAKVERLVNRLFAKGFLHSIPFQIGPNIHAKMEVSRQGIDFMRNSSASLKMTFKRGSRKVTPQIGGPVGSGPIPMKRSISKPDSAPVPHKASAGLADDAIDIYDDDDDWDPRIAESDQEYDSDIEIVDDNTRSTTVTKLGKTEDEHCANCSAELIDIRRKHPHLKDIFRDDVLQELSLILPEDLSQFKDILLSADVRLKDSEFKTPGVRALVDCCIRYRLEYDKLFKNNHKPAKIPLPVIVDDLHSKYSHHGSGKPSSSAKPASRR